MIVCAACQAGFFLCGVFEELGVEITTKISIIRSIAETTILLLSWSTAGEFVANLCDHRNPFHRLSQGCEMISHATHCTSLIVHEC